MATQRVLAIIGGKVMEYIAAITSSGVASSGQLVALNAAGQVDLTMMPTGIGADVVTVTASEALAAGAFVNIWSNAGVFAARNADGSTTGKEAHGFVLAAVASSGSATVYLSGFNNAVTGQVPGLVFLSATTAGGSATAGASAAGQTYQQLGMAISPTSIQFDPQASVVRA
jgi:hypothetical protein